MKVNRTLSAIAIKAIMLVIWWWRLREQKRWLLYFGIIGFVGGQLGEVIACSYFTTQGLLTWSVV